MEHWFDIITKLSACDDHVTRRGVFKAVLAGVGVAPLLLRNETVQANPIPVPSIRPIGGPIGGGAAASAVCTRTSVGGQRITRVSASAKYNGQSLTLRSVLTTIGGRLPQLTSFQRVDLGSNLLYESSLCVVPGLQSASGVGKTGSAIPVLHADIRYGPAVSGPRHVRLTIGKGAVRGFSDGHPINSVQQAQFPLSVDPELRSSVQDLLTSSSTGRNQCRTLAPMDATACEACHNACDNSLNACLAHPDFPWGPVGCAEDWYACHQNCSQVGGDCCKVQCEENECCGEGQTCCGLGAFWACCDSGSVCTTAVNELEDTIYYCCPAGSDPKGCYFNYNGLGTMYCHNPGEVCCGTIGPCLTGQFCADALYHVCCKEGQVVCAGLCCSGKCFTYNTGTSAEFQQCCSSNSVCGDSCCSGNQKCLTSSTGKKVCCEQPTLCGEECCSNGEICSNGHCGFGEPCGNGPPCGFAICCNGVCCQFNQTCVNGKCTTTGCPPGEVPCPVTPNQCCPPGLQCCNNNTCCDTRTTECCGGRGCVPIGTCIG